jgi:predicted 3-demethylubiquinone-9 3-methyltransferase (glyoxalase superfamily)
MNNFLESDDSTPQKIVPHLWFDNQAREAAEFYTSLLPNSAVTNITTLHNTPSGDADIVSFNIGGHKIMGINGGPLFKFNPSISFTMNFDPSKDSQASSQIDKVWEKLMERGKALMALDKYPFSERYGWVEDKYGLSWQLILTDPKGEERPLIIPTLLFVNEVAGKAKEATDYYLATFKNSRRGSITYYPTGMEPEKEGNVMYTDFMLEHEWFSAMDSSNTHNFVFNEAVSLVIECGNQQEIDYFWQKLSAHPEAEQCGWLKDVYGVSWQVVPKEMEEMMSRGTQEQIDRVTQALLPMKKIDVATLKKAFVG